MKGENGKNNRETKSYTAEKTAFNQFNPITIEEIKKDIANKKGIRKEDIDLSKFVHMRTILSIPSHKEIVEQEMETFLHKKYPKITMDSVKTIFNTMIDLSLIHIFILKLDQNLVGIKVDMVRDVVALEETDIEKNNIVTDNNGQMFIKAVGKHDDELISILGLHSVVIDREQA